MILIIRSFPGLWECSGAWEGKRQNPTYTYTHTRASTHACARA